MLITMSWLTLALLAPLLYAIIILIDDNLLRTVYKSPQVGAAISGVFGLVPALVLLILGHGDLSMPFGLALLSVVAGLILVISYYFYFQGFESANPSVVAAVLTLTPVLIPFVAHFLVDERLTGTAIAGFIILVVAAFAYTSVDTKKITINKTLLPVLVAALMLDGVAVANKFVYQRADFYAAFIYFSLGMLVGGLVFWVIAKQSAPQGIFKQLRTKGSAKLVALLVMVELLSLTAEFMHDRAISLGSVSLVGVLENLQPLYVLLIALLLFPFFPKQFREAGAGHIAIKLALALVMVGGVFLVAR